MLLEWLRRNMENWDGVLRTYLFTTAPITEVEEDATAGGSNTVQLKNETGTAIMDSVSREVQRMRHNGIFV